jgi:hypothetical protein
MVPYQDIEAIRHVVRLYLEGMIYGEPEKLRQSMHPLCMQAGHDKGRYEFFPRDEFIALISQETPQQPGSHYPAEIQKVDITGDMAIVKVSDDCFGTSWTDYLTLIKHEGVWQIVMKAFFGHGPSRQSAGS